MYRYGWLKCYCKRFTQFYTNKRVINPGCKNLYDYESIHVKLNDTYESKSKSSQPNQEGLLEISDCWSLFQIVGSGSPSFVLAETRI